MSKWKTVKLGDICEILDSQRIPVTAANRKAGIYPYYGANGVQDYVNGYIFDDELVLLAEDGGNFGSKDRPIAYRVSGKCWVNNHAHVLKPKAGLNVDYLCYSLMFYDVSDIVNGATRQKLNQAAMRKMQIPLPPLEEQKRISDILDKASNLIDLRKQQLEKMNLLIKSKFIDMFGDPVTNPKGWEVQRIEELCEAIFGGGTPSKSHAEYYDGDIPWVTSKDMKSILISDSIDHINDKAVLNSSAKYIPKQSLLMVIRSGILKHTLPLGINTRVVTINQDMKAFIPNANINVWFMFYTFKMHEKSLLNNVRAVTADNIEFSIIRNLMVPVPSLELQNQFAEFVEQVEKQKVVMQQSLEKMEMNYKALMQEYF